MSWPKGRQNGMAGKHYQYRIYRQGIKLRNKYLDITRASAKCVSMALHDKRGIVFEVIKVPSGRVAAHIARTRRTMCVVKWSWRPQ